MGDSSEQYRAGLPDYGFPERDIMLFFELEVETLTLIWAHGGNKRYLDRPYNRNANEKYAPLESVREIYMQDMRLKWMADVYEPSSWYREATDMDSVCYYFPCSFIFKYNRVP